MSNAPLPKTSLEIPKVKQLANTSFSEDLLNLSQLSSARETHPSSHYDSIDRFFVKFNIVAQEIDELQLRNPGALSNSFKEKLEAIKSESAMLSRELKNAEMLSAEKLMALENKYYSVNSELLRLRDEIEELVKMNNELKCELIEGGKDPLHSHRSGDRGFDRMNLSQIHEIEDSNHSLRQENAALKKQLSQIQAEIRSLQEKHETLREQLESQLKSFNEVLSEKMELNEKVQEKQVHDRDYQELKLRIEQFKVREGKTKRAIAELEQTIERQNEFVAQLKKELVEAREGSKSHEEESSFSKIGNVSMLSSLADKEVTLQTAMFKIFDINPTQTVKEIEKIEISAQTESSTFNRDTQTFSNQMLHKQIMTEERVISEPLPVPVITPQITVSKEIQTNPTTFFNFGSQTVPDSPEVKVAEACQFSYTPTKRDLGFAGRVFSFELAGNEKASPPRVTQVSPEALQKLQCTSLLTSPAQDIRRPIGSASDRKRASEG